MKSNDHIPQILHVAMGASQTKMNEAIREINRVLDEKLAKATTGEAKDRLKRISDGAKASINRLMQTYINDVFANYDTIMKDADSIYGFREQQLTLIEAITAKVIDDLKTYAGDLQVNIT